MLCSIFTFLTAEYYAHSRLAISWFLALLACSALWSTRNFNLREAGMLWAWLFTGCLILSALIFPNSNITWIEPYQFSAFVISFVCLGAWLAHTGRLQQAIVQFVIALHIMAFIYAVICAYIYIFAMLDKVERLDHLLPWGFINIRYWSQVASWALPLLPLSLLITPLKNYTSWRLSLYFTMAVWFWVLLLSVARGSGVGLVCSVLVTALLFRKASLPWLKIFIKGAIAGCIFWLVFSIGLPGLLLDNSELRNATLTSSGRIPLWKEAWAMSWVNFPLGMGPFSWVSHTPITEGFAEIRRLGHPHNMYLFFAAEYGWISVFALLGLGLHGVRRLLPLTKAAEPNMALVAFTASVVAALTHSFFSAVLITPNSLLIGLAVLSLYWGLLHQNVQLVQANPKIWKVWLVRLLAISMLLLGLLWLKQVYIFKEQVQRDLDDPAVRVIGINSPRFWDNSHIPQQSNEKDVE